jgi:1-phosphofructokinase family hexose kinase
MILCVGTTPAIQRTMTFERVTPDVVNRAVEVIESASGKSINVARTLTRLGKPALATGFVGGEARRLIREDLDRAGVGHEFVNVVPKTRTCTTVIDRAGGTVTEFVEEPQAVEPEAYERLLQVVVARLRSARCLVLSGSLPPRAPQDFYARCARLARKGGVPVVLDARREPLRLALAEQPVVVKPNREELAETVGFKLDCDSALRDAITSLLERGPRWALITDGPRDVIAADGTSFWSVTPSPIEPINSIGSGDAFAAGLAIALVEQQDLPAAARLAAACGAANALNSPPGHARPQDVDRLLPLVKITALPQ